jgi:hypothetical protein
MARGWESKDIESQQQSVEYERRLRAATSLLEAEQRERQAKKQSLLLSRTRVLNDLERATHPRHRAQLQLALAFLDEQLTQFA